MSVDIKLTDVFGVKVTPGDMSGHLNIEIDSVDEADIISIIEEEDFSVEDIVSAVGSDELLEEIGREACIEYFKIEEAGKPE